MRRIALNPSDQGLYPHFVISLLALLLFSPFLPKTGQAFDAGPITPSGLHTQVSDPITVGVQTQYNITGGTRPGGVNGTNLFHSFENFNVPTNNIANFLNSGSVDQNGVLLPSNFQTSNILAGVTGVDPSVIFGMIQTTNFGNANLFLMNPHGFLFGPNATVNVGGMMTFTTADYLRFQGTDTLFNKVSTPESLSLLSAVPVAAFGFLGSNPAAIAIQGSTLQVAQGQTLSIVGGNKGFNNYTNPDTGATGSVPDGMAVTGGHLLAPGGQVNIVSVASPGEVVAGTLDYAPNVNGQSLGSLGSINISQQSVIDVSGNGGGTVLIRGGQFVLDNSQISANVTGPGAVTNGVESIGGGIDIQVSQNAVIQNLAVLETNVTGNATPRVTYGGVHVKADRIEVLGTVPLEDAFGGADLSVFTGIRSDVRPGSTGGNSGAITLESNSILINNWGQLETLTEGAGNAGNIIVQANNNLDVDFGNIQAAAHPGSSGDAGDVELSSAQGNISLTNFTSVASQTVESPGMVGNLTLSAPGGNILLADAVLSTYLQPPINQAGVPAVRAGGSGRVLIEAMNLEANGADIGVVNLSNLPSGGITVNLSGSLSLRGGMFFTSSIHASSVGLLVNGSTLGAASSAGLNVSAHDILITDGSSLTTDTNSSGAAGPLNISANNLQLTSGGQIASKSRLGIDPQTNLPVPPPPSGPAGTVTIQGLTGPANSVLIDGAKSGIFTDTVGTGAGGSINILTQSLTIQNGGTLSAATTGTAPTATGGAITVKANQVQLSSGGLITAASTGLGASGVITIGAGSTFASNAGTVSTTTTQAQGGDINITAGQSITLNNRSLITATSAGPGNAGNIFINAGQNYTSTDSAVTTQATALGTEASGGNITVLATDTVQLTNNSQLNASVQGSSTTVGGNIMIDPQYVILQNSQIVAEATNGHGGAISINITNGGLFLPDANSEVSAQSGNPALNGTVTIQNPNAPAGGHIQPLGKSPLIATSLLNQRCAALAGGEFSSFTVASRDSLPIEPGSWLTSPLAFGLTGSGGTLPEKGVRAGIDDDSARETTVLSLRQIAPAGFLTQTFAVDSSASCHS